LGNKFTYLAQTWLFTVLQKDTISRFNTIQYQV